jgi:hypothetical protein
MRGLPVKKGSRFETNNNGITFFTTFVMSEKKALIERCVEKINRFIHDAKVIRLDDTKKQWPERMSIRQMIENGRCYWGRPYDDVSLAGYAQANKWEIIRIPEGEDGKYRFRMLMAIESTWREAKEIATYSYRADTFTKELKRDVVSVAPLVSEQPQVPNLPPETSSY